MTKVICGVNNLDANMAGKSVAEIRSILKQALNIDPEATPMIDGEAVSEDYVLANNDELEFVKASGEKG